MTAPTDQFVDIAKRSQEAVTTAVRMWADSVQNFAGNLTAGHAQLPDPQSVVDGYFDFAEKVLATQRRVASELISASVKAGETVQEQVTKATETVTAQMVANADGSGNERPVGPIKSGPAEYQYPDASWAFTPDGTALVIRYGNDDQGTTQLFHRRFACDSTLVRADLTSSTSSASRRRAFASDLPAGREQTTSGSARLRRSPVPRHLRCRCPVGRDPRRGGRPPCRLFPWGTGTAPAPPARIQSGPWPTE